jgi:hypothetical protein
MKRMAAQDPFKSQKDSPEYAIFPHRLVGIGGTARYIPATGREMGGHRLLIKPD